MSFEGKMHVKAVAMFWSMVAEELTRYANSSGNYLHKTVTVSQQGLAT